MFNREKLNFLKKWWLAIDAPVFIMIATLIFMSILFVSTSSFVIADRIGYESSHFTLKHIFFVFIGLFIIYTISNLNSNKIKLLTLIGFSGCVTMLIITILYGYNTKGSSRWLRLFGFSLQPSEFLKPLLTLLNCYILSYFHDRKRYIQMLILLIPYSISIFLLFMQPDLGVIILLSFMLIVQLFIAGFEVVYFVLSGIAFIIFSGFSYILFPHFSGRIDKYLGMLFKNDDANYQISKSIDAYKNGGLLGKGPMDGNIKNYIPDAHNDFIFAVVGEEFGALFCILILSIYFYISYRVIIKAIIYEKDFLKYISLISLSIIFISQAILNIGVTLSLLPTKGMTLPLLSYGGSSMIGICLTLGLILAISKIEYGAKEINLYE